MFLDFLFKLHTAESAEHLDLIYEQGNHLLTTLFINFDQYCTMLFEIINQTQSRRK